MNRGRFMEKVAAETVRVWRVSLAFALRRILSS